jgi:hypothetical protein
VNKQQHDGVPLRRVRTGDVRCEEFLYELKAASGPADYDRRRTSPLKTFSIVWRVTSPLFWTSLGAVAELEPLIGIV